MTKVFKILFPLIGIFLALSCSPALAQTAMLSSVDETAAFKAAGYKFINKQWISTCHDSDLFSYSPGTIELVRDLNGDGHTEAVIMDSSTLCHGNTEVGFAIVSKQANGSWKLIFKQSGIPNFLETKGVSGWPDIEIAGPGFCTGVWAWSENKYNYKCSREEKPGGCTWKNIKSICK